MVLEPFSNPRESFAFSLRRDWPVQIPVEPGDLGEEFL